MTINHIKISNPQDCCGCRNCENICPKQAIEMIENNEGFVYPHINNACVDCGLCTKVCPWINEFDRKHYLKHPKCYAAINNDIEVQNKSSSGGLFGAFAKYILDNNGLVCGAILDENLKVRHICIDKIENLEKLYGSKYIASELSNVFKQIKEELNNGRFVLFCGTPCQVNALLLYVQKEYDNLYTLEIICHGTPSQKLFDRYITYLEKKFHIKIRGYDFRNKKAAKWGTFKSLLTYSDGKRIHHKSLNADFDKYYKNFLDGSNYRESCYICKYAKKERNADVTIGDFWGIEDIMPEIIDYNGVSEIIINSNKGMALFYKIKDKVTTKDVNFDEIIKYNGQLEQPTQRPFIRDEYYKGMDSSDYFKNMNIKVNIKSYIKLLFPQSLKFKIKRLLKNGK